MEDQPDPVVTVRRRILEAGICAESFEQSLTAGLIRVAGQVVTDPETPAPTPVNVSFAIPPAAMMSRGVWS